jgi:hypothetical protein
MGGGVRIESPLLGFSPARSRAASLTGSDDLNTEDLGHDIENILSLFISRDVFESLRSSELITKNFAIGEIWILKDDGRELSLEGTDINVDALKPWEGFSKGCTTAHVGEDIAGSCFLAKEGFNWHGDVSSLTPNQFQRAQVSGI